MEDIEEDIGLLPAEDIKDLWDNLSGWDENATDEGSNMGTNIMVDGTKHWYICKLPDVTYELQIN